MEEPQYCYNHRPEVVEGTGAQLDGYHLRTFKDLIQGTTGNTYRRTYHAVKCRTGVITHFIVSAGKDARGQAIQILPLRDDNNAWPSLTYKIEGTVDGAMNSALPTPITGVAVTNAPGNIHGLVLPMSAYHITVTGAANTGYFVVMTSR